MSANTIDGIGGIIITTDDTQAILGNYQDLPNDCAFFADIKVVGRDMNSGDVTIFRKTASGKKVGSTVSFVGSVGDIVSPEKDLSLSSSSCDIIASAGDIQIKVTGIASTSIEWMISAIIVIN